MPSNPHLAIAAALLTIALPRLAGAATAAVAAGAPDAPDARDANNAARRIDRATLEAPIRFLADDLLEGRGPATRGDQLARLYLQSSLALLGLQPGGPGGAWQQPFDIIGVTAQPPEAWSFEAGGKQVAWKRWDDFIVASGVQKERAEIRDAELVFVGYGIQAPEYRWDDLKGADLRGKVLVMLNHNPEQFAGKRRLYYGRWTYKYESAARQGAAAAIIIHTTPSAGYPWQVVQTSFTGEKFSLPLAGGEPEIQVAGWATETAVKSLLAAAGHDLGRLVEQAQSRDFRPVPLGIRTSLAFANKVSRARTANVAGLLPGGDPKLRDEVVIFTAHHDHLGVGAPDKRGDKIYNGAVDNASGCAEVLAIAKAFAALGERPRRSILFLLVGVEEQGLLGSEYYAEHPTFPPGKIAANLNFDSANIFGRTREIASLSLGRSTLDPIVAAIAARQGRRVVGDPFPDRGFFYRSDQFNFAKIGVPALYFKTGTDFVGRPADWGKEQLEAWERTRYHQPSDELTPDWNFDGIIEDAQLGFYTGLAIAQSDRLPAWNPGDEFEAARKKALAGEH